MNFDAIMLGRGFMPAYRFGICLALIFAIPSSFVAIARARALPPSSNTNASAAATRNVVVGIISYVSWPRSPSAYRLCIIGRTEYANGPFLNGTEIGTRQILTQHITINNSQLGANCDVAYLGAITQSNRRILQAELTGHRVVTITEEDETCSDSSMFCLLSHGTDVSFAVNLDSVARSGMEVDPRVLLLGSRHSLPQ